MLHKRQFVKKTRKGNILKVVREHYLRDDIPCCSAACETCPNLISTESLNDDEEVSNILAPALLEEAPEHYLVVDTNIILLQIDLLCHNSDGALKNIIVPQTVLEEVKHRDPMIHKRLREIITNKDRHFIVFSNEHHRETYVERLPSESPNDRNDRAIRRVARWYNDHLPQIRTILISNDRENLRIATQEDIPCKTIKEYVRSMGVPAMLDILTETTNTSSQKIQVEDEDVPGKFYPFPKHLRLDAAREGIQKLKHVRGMFRACRDGPNEGRVRLDYGKGEDVAIIGIENVNRAIEGDIVFVEVLSGKPLNVTPSAEAVDEKEDLEEATLEAEEELPTPIDPVMGGESLDIEASMEQKKPERFGKVVAIAKRSWKQYVGMIDSTNSSETNNADDVAGEWVTFVPNDIRIPRGKIKTSQKSQLLNKLLTVSFDSWERSSLEPTGHLVKVLGDIGDVSVETEAILLMFEIPYNSFTPEALAALPTMPWGITDDEVAKRADFRNLRIASIDPPGCTDIDDALHHRLLPNGNSEIGVHIADVTHFVPEDSALDKEAWIRSNTVYLANRRIDMLPPLLGTNLCSLRSNVDRYAFSVLWEVTPEGEIVDTKFTRSIIRSIASLTYQQAQERIDDVNAHDELTKDLRQLMRISKIIKEQRVAKGALTLASPEVKVVRDPETHEPLDVELYQLRETNSLVEEFMLLANVSVAQKIYTHFPQFSMLRRHPVPPSTNFDDLNKSLRRVVGLELDVSTSKKLSESLDKATIPNNAYFNNLVRIMATRCMTQAVYFSSGTLSRPDFLHYGLACEIYTHFTSPIRRYADVVVHRLLAACLGYTPVSLSFSKEKVKRLCNVINKRHHTAQIASRASTEFFTIIFFKDRTYTEDAYVTRVKEDGFNALVPRFGYEGWIPIDTKQQGDVVFDNDNKLLEFKDKGVKIQLFDRIKVQLSVDASMPRKKMRVVCIEPSLSGIANGKEEEDKKRKVNETISAPTLESSSTSSPSNKKKKTGTSTPTSTPTSPPSALTSPSNGQKKKNKKKKNNKKTA